MQVQNVVPPITTNTLHLPLNPASTGRPGWWHNLRGDNAKIGKRAYSHSADNAMPLLPLSNSPARMLSAALATVLATFHNPPVQGFQQRLP